MRRLICVVFGAAWATVPAMANPIPIPPPASMPLEDMHIQIGHATSGMHAVFAGDYTFTYIPTDVTRMLFPVPPDAMSIAVRQDGIALAWSWASERYPTVLPELPTIPMIQWAGPFPQAGCVFHVDYEHALLERPGESIFFYACGTGKYFPTYEKTTRATFDIDLPADVAVRGVWLDNTQHPYQVAGDHVLVTVESQFGPITQDLIASLVPSAQADLDHDADVDLDDFAMFQSCFNGPNRAPAPVCVVSADLDSDKDVDLDDFQQFQGCFNGPNRPPACESGPRIARSSHSDCLSTWDSSGEGAPDAACGDDTVEVMVGPGALYVVHRNATYNCCLDDIRVSLSAQDNHLTLTEKEILTTPCKCLCCYEVETDIVDLIPGVYVIEYCWDDYETGGPECRVLEVVIP